jgi:Flp pilus assembly pilin Flp
MHNQWNRKCRRAYAGQTMAEYAMIVAALALALLISFQIMGFHLRRMVGGMVKVAPAGDTD